MISMEKNIKITIITISYNAESTIEDTLKSIEKQRYDNLEYIIVDSESTDKTIEIVKKYDHIVTKIICEKDRGISDAFNKGIAASTGDIIGIINADDILCKNALHILAKQYEENVDVYRGKILKWNPERKTQYEVIPSMDLIPHGQKIVVAHPGTFIKRDAYKKYGRYDLKCKTMMDYELLMRFAKRGAEFKYIPQILAAFRIGGITTDNKKVLINTPVEIREKYYVLKKNGIKSPVIFGEILKTVGKNIIKFVLRVG